MSNMRNLGLTADIRGVRADDALTRHPVYLTEQRALRLGMEMCFRLFHRHHRMNCSGTALLLPPGREGPEGKESAKAPRAHALLMQRKRRSAPRREHNIHPARQIPEMTCKRRDGDAVLLA